MRQAQTIDLGGGRSLHAVMEGEGPDLLLLHGMLTTSHDWLSSSAFDAFVRAGFRVTAIDRPGHGLSRRLRFEGSPREQAKQIRAGLHALRMERVTIVGHSFGGLVALAYAELFPEAVERLVLVAPITFPEPRLIEHLLLAPRAMPLLGPAFSTAAGATIDQPVLKMIQRLMFSPQPVPDGWEASYPYGQVLDAAAMVAEGEDAAAMLPLSPTGTIDLAAIRTPTRILTGDSDRVVQYQRQAKLAAGAMPNASLCVCGGIGHMLHHARPEALVEAVKERVAA
jgi:pimeloyl-ACP methyl ester carboxylesterase